MSTYDRELQRITDLYEQACERDQSLLRVDSPYRRPHLANWENISEILDITLTLSKVKRQKSSIVQNMAQLPESERMQFWHEQFLPLQAQERGLRAKLLVVGERMSLAEQ